MPLSIDSLNLSNDVKKLLAETGINKLFPSQEEAIKNGLLNLSHNFLIVFPTSAGKTLCAELFIVQALKKFGGKALYLVPLRALASEKYMEFKKYEKLGFKVAISTGDYDSKDIWLGGYDIVILTNEKCDSLIRHKAPWLNDVSVVVFDEIHLIRDPIRGPTLEMVVTKIRRLLPNTKILALSATVRNYEEIAEWLNAKAIISDWRPVPLYKGILYDSLIQFVNGDEKHIENIAGNPIIDATLTTIRENGQVLIFTSTRRIAQQLARKLALHVVKEIPKNERLQLRALAGKILEISPVTTLSRDLADVVGKGVAFHHAGLHYEHRCLIEENFRNGLIKVICATPTLAAGVNLPARRVIISNYVRYSALGGRQEISVLEFEQMSGRAGRPQYDKYGEALLYARNENEKEYLIEQYLMRPPEYIFSQLASEHALRMHVLAVISEGIANTPEDILSLMSSTFYGFQYGTFSIRPLVLNVLEYLVDKELAKKLAVEGKNYIVPTPYGKRVSELYIDPETAVILKEAIIECNLKSPIEIFFVFASTPDMPTLAVRGKREEVSLLKDMLDRIKNLEPLMEKLGIDESFALSAFKTALMLEAWIAELSEDAIESMYGAAPGDLYRIVKIAEWLTYSTFELARVFGLASKFSFMKILEERIRHGVREELLELVKIPNVGRTRARTLFDAGFKTLEDLKKASPSRLMALKGIGSETVKAIYDFLGMKVRMRKDETKPEGDGLITDYM
ncbi:ATP-dependent DNA helicase [archaeon]|nr:MAG: ATP-dependent DNA helicase [archaeon]RLG64432.1 MAG: ATP-dependent DNA helicase [archaeon]